MRLYRTAITVLFVLVLGLTARHAAASSPEDEGASFDLAITGIEPTTADINVGDEVSFKVTYANLGEEPTPDSLAVYILLTVTTTAESPEPVGAPCIEQAPGAAGLSPGATNSHGFTTCNLILPLEGNYIAQASFVTINAGDAAEPTYSDLADASPENNTILSRPFQVGPAASSLPDDLGRLFAGLGMFAAVMAIMAVGTEVVIDTGKVALGMKSKVKSLDALERMEKLLPGQLSDLGVTTTSLEQFETVTAEMRRTLQPVGAAGDIAAAIQEGHFKTAFTTLAELAAASGQLQPMIETAETLAEGTVAQLESFRKQAVAALNAALQGIAQAQSALGVSEPSPFLAAAVREIESLQNGLNKPLDEQDPAALVQAFAELQETLFRSLQTWSQQLTAEWLQNQRDQLLTLTHEGTMQLFDAKVKPVLEQLAFLDNKLADEARTRLDAALGVLDAEATAKSDAYITSLENLLNAVEGRRTHTQSPLRKLWRRLREAKDATFWFAAGAGAATFLAESLLNWSILGRYFLTSIQVQSAALLRYGGALIGALFVSVVLYLVVTILGQVGERVYQSQHDGRPIQHSSRAVSNFDRIESLWNMLLGRNPDPDSFGVAPRIEGLTPATIAKIVLERSDQQRDEESSRLRWLRAISVVVGMILAYLLQIDAAVLLDAAVPGVAGTINGVFSLSGEQLRALLQWDWLPPDRAITAGIVLTGMAASAGSAFWHDQLDRLQSAKKGAESAFEFLELARRATKS